MQTRGRGYVHGQMSKNANIIFEGSLTVLKQEVEVNSDWFQKSSFGLQGSWVTDSTWNVIMYFTALQN